MVAPGGSRSSGGHRVYKDEGYRRCPLYNGGTEMQRNRRVQGGKRSLATSEEPRDLEKEPGIVK